VKGTAIHHCAFISTVRGSRRRVVDCMWKDARIRQSTLDSSELLNIALTAQHLPQSPKGGCFVNKACVDGG